MTALRTYRDALAALLTTDAVFVAAVAAIVGQPVTTVLKSNRAAADIAPGMYPCWVLEVGDGHAATVSNDAQEYQTIGLALQTAIVDMHIALVWMDQDRDHASDGRVDLPYHLTQLLLRNPQPGGCEQAVLVDWQPDRGANHPTQFWRARIASGHVIQRDA